MSVKDRLVGFINYKGMTIADFERVSGLSNSYVAKIKTSIGKYGTTNINRAFPELNMKWLLTGEGEMLNPTHQSVGNISNSSVAGVNVNGQEIHINPDAYQTLLKIVESNQRTTDKFQEQIDRLINILEKRYEF